MVIMAKAVARCLVAIEPNRAPKARPPEAADQRDQLGRQPERAVLDGAERVRGAVATQAEEDGVAEGQQARLSHLHVERQGKDRHQADLAHHRQHEAGMAARRPVVEQPRHQQHHRHGDQPRQGTAHQAHGTVGRGALARQALRRHASRVPIRPRGLNTRISTSMIYGSSAPMRGSGTMSTSWNGVALVTVRPNCSSRSASE